jgi:hypothetical protein
VASQHQVSVDPRSRRRRTLHPDQRALPIAELAEVDAIYGYSFILTNLEASTKDKAAAFEHWYRYRTSIENVFRDGKLGAALRHQPSGYPEVNTAWMWGALLAASMAAWLHQLTATTQGEEIVAGHGVRGGKAMIVTLRHRLIRVPARLISHANQLILRLPPGHNLLPETSPDSERYQHSPDTTAHPPRPEPSEPANPARHPGHKHARAPSTPQ